MADEDSFARIQELEKQVESLQQKNIQVQRKAQAEWGKIRDAWKEKLDGQVNLNKRYRQEIERLRKSQTLLEQEVALIPEYRNKLAALEREHLELESLKENKSTVRMGQGDIIRLAEEKAHLSVTVEICQSELQAWRRAAEGILDAVDIDVTPAALEMKLVEITERAEAADSQTLQHATETNRLNRRIRDLEDQVKASDREKRQLNTLLKEAEKSLQVSEEDRESLNTQIGVLRRCLQQRQEMEDCSGGTRQVTSPKTDPLSVSPSEDIEAHPITRLLRQQLADRNAEGERLRMELRDAEAKNNANRETEAQLTELKSKLEKSYQIRQQLVTQVQKLSMDLATRPLSRQDEPAGENLVECLRKERDGATRRAETLKAENKYRQELWNLLIQKVLGWRISLHEDKSGEVLFEAQSIYSPDEDPGFVRVSVGLAELLSLFSTTEAREHAKQRLGGSGRRGSDTVSVISTEECTTPISSMSGGQEPQLSMSFRGRYREKWKKDERWRDQLAGRKGFPTFLAFVILDEHHARQRRAGWRQPSNASPAASLISFHKKI